MWVIRMRDSAQCWDCDEEGHLAFVNQEYEVDSRRVTLQGVPLYRCSQGHEAMEIQMKASLERILREALATHPEAGVVKLEFHKLPSAEQSGQMELEEEGRYTVTV